ncbi:MAG: CHAD domain-containing protein [Burkholderiales bacterium]
MTSPPKMQGLRLAGSASAIEAFGVIARTLLRAIQATRRGAIAGHDPEHLHQMRVAVRRLRALCSDFAKVLPASALQPLIADIKWLAHTLGPARDADVFTLEIWPVLRAALSDHPQLAALDAQWLKQRRAKAVMVRRALMSRRFQQWIAGFRRWLRQETWRSDASPKQLAVLNGTAGDFARRVVSRCNAKVRDHGRSLAKIDALQLHALRIQVKKLRYAADSFSSLFEKPKMHRMLKRLSHLQNMLGALHDVQVAEQSVAAALAGRRGRSAIRNRVAAEEWCQARKTALRRDLHVAWRAYRRVSAKIE